MKAAIGPTIAGAHASSDVSDALLYVPDTGPNVVNIASAAHPERGPIGQITDGNRGIDRTGRRDAQPAFSPVNRR